MLVTHRSPTLLLGKSRCAVRGLESASARFRTSSTRGPSRCRCGCRRQRRSHSVVARGDGRLVKTPRLRPQRLKPQAPSNCRSGAFSATSPNILFRLLRAASPARSMPRSDAAYRAENATGGSPRVIRREHHTHKPVVARGFSGAQEFFAGRGQTALLPLRKGRVVHGFILPVLRRSNAGQVHVGGANHPLVK